MPITCEIRDRIAEIVFDVPPVNAFDSATWMSIPDIISEAGRNPDVNCILIRAEGRGFCGGVDIKEMQAHPERITILNRGNYLTFKAIRDAEVPVVVAAHKFVIGGGIGICGASDTIIAADDAFFSLPEVDRGAMGGQRCGLGVGLGHGLRGWASMASHSAASVWDQVSVARRASDAASAPG